MKREPIVAGRFYTDSPQELAEEVTSYLSLAEPSTAPSPTLLAMVPHAGYTYSGALAGKTLGEANLPGTLFLLGPNHTGRGKGVAVWPSGSWRTPLGSVQIDAEAASCLISHDPIFTPDIEAHRAEHSLEVLLPFLQIKSPDTRIVPIAFSDPSPETLARVGATLAHCMKLHPETAMVVSSDMSHYISRSKALELDGLALKHIRSLDAEGLYNVVRANQISMCGVLPMTAALIACKLLGAFSAQITGYTDSGAVTGEEEQVVAYAGAIVSPPKEGELPPL